LVWIPNKFCTFNHVVVNVVVNRIRYIQPCLCLCQLMRLCTYLLREGNNIYQVCAVQDKSICRLLVQRLININGLTVVRALCMVVKDGSHWPM
jgi:hypothetical protein